MIEITEKMIEEFADLTGDRSPIHLDAEFAQSTPYKSRIAHGLLSASIAMGEVTHQLASSESELVSSASIRLTGAVKLGDSVTTHLTETDTTFEQCNQSGVSVCSGEIGLSRLDMNGGLVCGELPQPMRAESFARDGPDVYYAEDILRSGPRGEAAPRVVTADAIHRFVELSGAPPAETGIAPAMLVFSWAFADFLNDLTTVKLPDAGFAGHVGDNWQLHAPVCVGDTVRTRHKPAALRPSRSRPELAILEFALQTVNSAGSVALQGSATMLVPQRS